MNESKPGAVSLFPLPLIAPPLKTASRSRRVAQRYARAVATTSSANCTINALNSLASSYSVLASPLLQPSNDSRARNFTTPASSTSTPPTSAQERALAHVYRCAARFVCRRDFSRSACDDDPFFDQCFLSDHLQLTDLDTYINRPLASVVPVVSDRISLPSAAGAVDLLSILPPSAASLYSTPHSLVLPPEAHRTASSHPPVRLSD
jgi:hypothetical protein